MGETRLSYNSLNCADNKIASSIGLKDDGDFIVTSCMQPSDEVITTLLAILKMEYVYLPIDCTFPQNRLDHILQVVKPFCVIYDDACVDRCLFGCNTLSLSFSKCFFESLECNEASISDDRMLSSGYRGLILYTSGSTSMPEGKYSCIFDHSDQIPNNHFKVSSFHIQLYRIDWDANGSGFHICQPNQLAYYRLH